MKVDSAKRQPALPWAHSVAPVVDVLVESGEHWTVVLRKVLPGAYARAYAQRPSSLLCDAGFTCLPASTSSLNFRERSAEQEEASGQLQRVRTQSSRRTISVFWFSPSISSAEALRDEPFGGRLVDLWAYARAYAPARRFAMASSDA